MAHRRQQEADRDGHDWHGCADVEGYTHISGLSCTELAGILAGSVCIYASLAYHYTPEESTYFVKNCPVTCDWCPCTDACGGDWVIERDSLGLSTCSISNLRIMSNSTSLQGLEGVTNIGGD